MSYEPIACPTRADAAIDNPKGSMKKMDAVLIKIIYTAVALIEIKEENNIMSS